MDNKNLIALHQYFNQRQGRVYNQKEFADILGITASNLSLLESGKKAPSINEARAYRELMGASLDYIYGYSEYPNPVGYKMGALLDIAGNTEHGQAVKAINHLIGDYDCLAFFTLLDALWQTEPQDKLDMVVTDGDATDMADCLIQCKNKDEAFPIRCKIERLILGYIQSHPYKKEPLHDVDETGGIADKTDGLDDIIGTSVKSGL